VATIDSLCYELLKRYPEEAGLNIKWKVTNKNIQRTNLFAGTDVHISELVSKANELIENYPDIFREFVGIYPKLIFDALDLFTGERHKFLQQLFVYHSSEVWCLSENGEYDKQNLFPQLIDIGDDRSEIYQILEAIFRSKASSTADSKKIRLHLAPNKKSELSAICQLAKNQNDSDSGSLSQAIYVSENADLPHIHKSLKSNGLVKSELNWLDNPPKKDIICLLILLCDYQAELRDLIEHRLTRLFPNQSQMDVEINRLKSFISPTDALKEFLIGGSRFAQEYLNQPFVLEFLQILTDVESEISSSTLTPDKPGGGVEADQSLFIKVIDQLINRLRIDDFKFQRNLYTDSCLDKVHIISPHSKPARRYDIVYLLGFGQTNKAWSTQSTDKLSVILDASNFADKQLVISSYLDHRGMPPSEIRDLFGHLGQKQSDIISAPQIQSPVLENLNNQGKTKPCFNTEDLELYTFCPRKFRYENQDFDILSNNIHKHGSAVELTNCIVIDNESNKHEMVKDQKSHRSGINKWFNNLIEAILNDNSPNSFAPGLSLRYELAVDGILKNQFDPNPKSLTSCRTCEFRFVCPE
jgi:hypothetical protein